MSFIDLFFSSIFFERSFIAYDLPPLLKCSRSRRRDAIRRSFGNSRRWGVGRNLLEVSEWWCMANDSTTWLQDISLLSLFCLQP